MKPLPLALLLLGTLAGSCLGDDTDEGKLRDALFSSYDVTAKPAYFTMLKLTTAKILQFDLHETSNTAETTVWLGWGWEDARLQWDPALNGNISHISINPDHIWLPDFALYNGDKMVELPISETPVLAFSNGNILHVPSMALRYVCDLDLTYWPHDSQNCTIKLGSWTYSALQMDININDTEPEIENEMGLDKSSWQVDGMQLVRHEKFYSCCPEPYVSITLSIQVTRQAPAYAWTVKAPVICITLLTAVVFLLPPAAHEKVLLGALCLVLDVLFLNHTAGYIGLSPSHTPLLVQLLVVQMVLVLASAVWAALVVRVARGPHTSGPSPAFRKHLHALAPFLLLANYKGSVEPGSKAEEAGLDKSETRAEWLLVAAMLDRLALLAYMIITAITLLRFTHVL